MIYVYSNTTESVGGKVLGTAAIVNTEQDFSEAISELEELQAGIYYLSVHTLNGPNSSRSYVRFVEYVRRNFREKIECIGVGNTFAHFMITLT